MGCSSSLPQRIDLRLVDAQGLYCPGKPNEMPKDWIAVVVNTKTGDIMVCPTADGQSTPWFRRHGSHTLAKFTIAPWWFTTRKIKRRHSESSTQTLEKGAHNKCNFVQQKIGGTWVETKSNSDPGGKVKFTCLDKAALDAAWKEAGAKAWQTGEVSEETQSTASTEASANSQGMPKRQHVRKGYEVGGSAEWQRENQSAKVFVMQGVINGQVVVVDKDSGEVVLNLEQSLCGNRLHFYEILPPQTRLSKQEEKAMLNKAFCGMRNMTEETSDDDLKLFLSPETLEKIPISLFAITTMYSSFTLNSMPC